jgi:ferric-dicitrate binding protein FerR (iron transport regulator)
LNNTQEYLKHLLDRELWTSEEKEWMLNYLDKADLSDLEAVAVESFHTDLASIQQVLDKKLSADILRKIHQRINAPRPSFGEMVRLYRTKIAAAAIIIIVAGAGYFLRQGLRSDGSRQVVPNGAPDGQQVADAGHGPDFPAMGDHMHRVITVAKERRTVQLPDGSHVSLEQGSTLNYPDSFSGKTREIYLDGEAFFEVTKNPARPFKVHTRLITTTVLGTSFNVEAYANRQARIVVVTGRVKVQVTGQGLAPKEVVITPNEAAAYYKLPDRLEKQEAAGDAVFYQQRRSGRFVYPGVAVSKVVEDMQRFYHTRLVLQGDVQHCIFHGHFHTSDDLDKALTLIAIPLNASIRKDSAANGYIIYGGGCQ